MKTSLKDFPYCKDCPDLYNNAMKELELPLVDEDDNCCILHLKGLSESCPKNLWRKDFEAELQAMLFLKVFVNAHDPELIKEILGEEGDLDAI